VRRSGRGCRRGNSGRSSDRSPPRPASVTPDAEDPRHSPRSMYLFEGQRSLAGRCTTRVWGRCFGSDCVSMRTVQGSVHGVAAVRWTTQQTTDGAAPGGLTASRRRPEPAGGAWFEKLASPTPHDPPARSRLVVGASCYPGPRRLQRNLFRAPTGNLRGCKRWILPERLDGEPYLGWPWPCCCSRACSPGQFVG
jgi:hypothetical protein